MKRRFRGSAREEDAAKSCGYLLRHNASRKISVDEDDLRNNPNDIHRGRGGYTKPAYAASIHLTGLTHDQAKELMAWVSGEESGER